ncbi:TM2 domain-containing protein [Mumia sp. zg.B21]|nr:TM2 domain-containing protein [Mumia sp. zg.B21]
MPEATPQQSPEDEHDTPTAEQPSVPAQGDEPPPPYDPPAPGDSPTAEQPSVPAQGDEPPPPPYDPPAPGPGEAPYAPPPGPGQPPYAPPPGPGQPPYAPPAGPGQPPYGPPQQQPPYGAPYGYAPEAKSKLVAGLLGILLGGFGIHRFYLGFTTIGVVQIVVTIITCGLGAIWGFVEGILYLVGANGWTTDASGRPLKE